MAYRPALAGRLRYSFGGRLPTHREWVRHDLLDAGWRWRVLVRICIQILPVLIVLALLPGPAFLHVLMPLFVLICALFIGGAYGDDLRDRRLRQHDLPVPNRRDEGPRYL